MINNDLEIRIKAISESDNVLKALNAQIKEVTNELNKLHMQGKQGTAEWNSYKSTLDGLISKKNQLKEATTGVSTGLSGMMSQLNAIKTGVYAQLFIEIAEAVVAVGRAVINAAKEVLNFALTGARFSELKKHFEDVRGGADNAEKSMKLFRQAAAGEMSDAELIKYANTMRDLGHSDEETAKILDFSEKVVKNYGGTMEEAEAKVRRFLETGKAKGFEGMAVSIRQVTEDAKKLAIQQGYNYEKLDDESKLVLKTTAFYNRYSSSIDEINKKKLDEAEKIESLKTLYENLKLKLEEFVSKAIAPMVEKIHEFIGVFGTMVQNLKNSGFGELTNTIIKLAQQGFNYLVDIVKDKVLPAINDLIKYIVNFVQKNSDMFDGLKNLAKIIIDVLVEVVKIAIGVFKGLLDVFDWVVGACRTMNSWIDSIGKAFASIVPTAWVESIKKVVSDAKQALKDLVQWVADTPILGFLIPGLKSTSNAIETEKISPSEGDYRESVKPWAKTESKEERKEEPDLKYKPKEKKEEDKRTEVDKLIEAYKSEANINGEILSNYADQYEILKQKVSLMKESKEKDADIMKLNEFSKTLMTDGNKLLKERSVEIEKQKKLDEDRVKLHAQEVQNTQKLNDIISGKKVEGISYDQSKTQTEIDLVKLREKIRLEEEANNQAIVDLETQIKINDIQNTPESKAKNKALNEEIKLRIIIGKLIKENGEKEIKFFKDADKLKTFQTYMGMATQAMSAFFNTMNTAGTNVGQGLKSLLKSILTSILNYMEGMLLAAKATGFMKAIISFGASLIGDLPFIALALVAIETFKGIIGQLAMGTQDWRGGLAIVGEQGPELVNLPVHSQVIPNNRLQGYGYNRPMAGNSNTPIYIVANQDGFTYHRTNKEKYDNFMRKKRG